MDSPLLTLIISILFGFHALVAESQQDVNPPPPPIPPPPATPPPPPPYTTPPPPPYTPPPSPPYTTPPQSPPDTTPPPPPPYTTTPPPPLYTTPPPPPSYSTPPPPPPPPPPEPSRRHLTPPGGVGPENSIPQPERHTLNTGKKIGLMFIAIAVILQVCVAAFLFITRRQLLKAENAY
ncbi:hypothetical protein CASFOL_014759 [Castilleja foliolosa]|uniref:Uncharacterized protein n=1 Tax=Castilleja foliolosa TaxID=1961234 RepID=A0ABD3DFT7_9LAMI